MPAKEFAVGCWAVCAAIGIVVGVGMAGRRRDLDRGDADRMRRLYVGLSLYEESNGGSDPPNLTSLAFYLPGPTAFLSARDPYADTRALRYPNDAGLPDGPRRAPYRISFAYAGDFPGVSRTDRRVVLADEWIGSVDATGDFHAQVSGPVLRVTGDGAITRTRDRGGPKELGDSRDLFGQK